MLFLPLLAAVATFITVALAISTNEPFGHNMDNGPSSLIQPPLTATHLRLRDTLATTCFPLTNPAPMLELNTLITTHFCPSTSTTTIHANNFFGAKYALDAGDSVWMQLSNTDAHASWTVDPENCVENMLAVVDFCNGKSSKKQGGVGISLGLNRGFTVDVNFAGNAGTIPTVTPS
ncbi:hypothetical protein B0A50_05626 [Salinomyces thailandicus]|uniref:Ecp2 effector protein domain-containing protein n=1 Tax=Salinomyces thailandicus TaxID=706561 RepID=A0A4U0TU79_9PEZI|nr:hypothetical protein B0A50_05626 [Salinomyces thailandica]